MKRLTLLALLATSCVPLNPVPGPSPTDAAPPLPTHTLAGLVFDCDAPWVAQEHDLGAPIVEACLDRDGEDYSDCLAQTATVIHPDTVGCEMRDVGVRTSTKVASQTATPTELRTAERVRSLIRELRVSYR